MSDFTLENFRPGQRVELAPHTDAWMFGDQYGEVLRTARKYVHVRMDRSGKVRKLLPQHIGRINL